MLNGWYRGQKIGSGTNTISMSEQLRAGEITLEEWSARPAHERAREVAARLLRREL